MFQVFLREDIILSNICLVAYMLKSFYRSFSPIQEENLGNYYRNQLLGFYYVRMPAL